MDASGSPRVWRGGRFHEADNADTAMTALCQAVERAVRAHQTDGISVRAVILMFDHPAASAGGHDARPEPVPVYVDVFDSGFHESGGQDSGYGHGI